MKFPEFNRPSPLTVVLFLVTWFAVGFASGTVTLLGPVPWVATAMRDGGAAAPAERLAVMTIIVVYVSLSFAASLMLTRMASDRGAWLRLAVPVGAWAAAGACLWLWMTPQFVNRLQPVQIDTVARFTFGAYPERERFAALAEARVQPPADFEFDQDRFERGPIIEIDEAIFVAPYPTDEEMSRFVFGGSFASVVSLLDPENPDDKQWIEKEKQILADYGVPFSLHPVSWINYSPAAALAAAEHVRSLPRPVLVHAFRSEGAPAESFMMAYRSGLPPVSKASFEDEMVRGQPHVVAPNVVLGPRPRGPEFGSFLRARGIRSIVYVGDGAHDDARHDRTVAEQEAALGFHAMPADVGRVAALVSVDGPWYVYGPGLSQIRSDLEARFAGSLGTGPVTATAAAGR